MQPDARHQPVHDERGARHVAGVFQHPEEEKEDENLRQKNDHAADAGDDAIGDQTAQIAIRQFFTDATRKDSLSPASIQSIGFCATQKMQKNISAITPRNATQPQTRWVSTASSRSEMESAESRRLRDAPRAQTVLNPVVARLDRRGDRIEAGRHADAPALRAWRRSTIAGRDARQLVERPIVQREQQQRFRKSDFGCDGQMFRQRA